MDPCLVIRPRTESNCIVITVASVDLQQRIHQPCRPTSAISLAAIALHSLPLLAPYYVPRRRLLIPLCPVRSNGSLPTGVSSLAGMTNPPVSRAPPLLPTPVLPIALVL